MDGKRSYVTVSGKSYRGDVQPLPVTLVWSVVAILAIWIAFNALLYGSIFYGSFTVNWGVDYTLTLDNFIKLFGQGMSDGAWPSLLDTLLYAGIAAPLPLSLVCSSPGGGASTPKAKDHRVHHHAVLCRTGYGGGRLVYSRL